MPIAIELSKSGRLHPSAWVVPCCLLVALCLALLAAIPAFAAGDTGRHFNLDAEGYAINRFDPVAYFTMHKAVKGDTAYTASHGGARYAFASEEHLRMFLADPERFVPQYGGHCAYGAAYGSKSSIDPELWEIVDDRLFLLINPGTMSVWQKRKDEYIRSADRAWKALVESN